MRYLALLMIIAGLAGMVARPATAEPSTPLSLDEYVEQAIKKGIAGQKNMLAFESAGYTREVVFRQTDSPTLSAGNTATRSGQESDVGGLISTNRNTSQQSNLTMKEITPLGTVLQTQALYGDSDKPGINATIAQPLYLFVHNSVLRTRKTAQLNFENAKSSLDSTYWDIRTTARGFYYDVVQAEESIKVNERTAHSAQKLMDVTEALVEAGKTAPVETMRAKLRLMQSQRQVHNSQTQKMQAELTAKNYIFLPLDAPVHFVTQMQFVPLKAPLERLIDYAMLHQPQLAVLRRAQDLAELDLQAAVEPTRPTLSLNGQYGYNALPLATSNSWQMGWAMNWTFFDSFVTRDNVRNARIALYVANLNLVNGEQTARVNVTSAYLDIKRTEKQIIEFKTSREQSVRDVEVLRLRFQNGLDRLVDVFQAEDDMTNLDNEYLGLLLQFNRSKDQLSSLIGADVESLQ